jgi:hypothetical protein
MTDGFNAILYMGRRTASQEVGQIYFVIDSSFTIH